MIRVSIIGSGNVAQHLIKAFINCPDVSLEQVFSRSESAVSHLVSPDKITTDYAKLSPVDLYLIAVSDNAIAEVSSQLPFQNQLVAHTSGSVPMQRLDHKNRSGVFYPLQTFSKNKPVDFTTIPICLESQTAADYAILETVANAISKHVFNIDSQQRKALHVAAVFVNNFTNHLYEIGADICQKNNMPFDILKPLIRETAEKITHLSPKEAQTGPAKRNDTQTIAAHLDFLKTEEKARHIYEILTKSILENGKKL